MGSRSIMRWPQQVTTSLVEQLIRSEKDLEKAISIFDAATAEYSTGFHHDQNTFGLMIKRLLSANKFMTAEDMLDRMRREKCTITENIVLSFLRAYARVHKPHEVVRVFRKMKEYECEPTVKSYVTVFSVLVDESQLKMAFNFYRYMRQMGIPTSVASLNVLIKALCKSRGSLDSAFMIFREMPKRGHTPDSYTYGTLICGLCKAGRNLEARELLLEMEANGCSPSVVTYSLLVHGLCQTNKLDEALELLKEMKSKGIEPNLYTYSSLIDGLCKNGHSSQAMKLLDRMIRKRQVPNLITYSSLIHGFCSEGKVQDAVQILDRIKLQELKPDVGLYSKIINGYCDISKFQEAANFLDEMVLSDFYFSVRWATIFEINFKLQLEGRLWLLLGIVSIQSTGHHRQMYLHPRMCNLIQKEAVHLQMAALQLMAIVVKPRPRRTEFNPASTQAIIFHQSWQ